MKLNEVTISYQRKVPFKEMTTVTESYSAFKYLSSIKEWKKNIDHIESTYILLLNRSNNILGYSNIGKGGIHGCVIDPIIIFQTAIKTNAVAIILAHNHPTGRLEPSKQDIAITKKIKSGAKILGIQLLDHLIISSDGYYSFSDDNKI